MRNKSGKHSRRCQNKQMKHTMCKLMWFVVLLQAILTFKTMSLFSSPELLPRSRSTEKHSTLFHLYHAIHLIRFKWFTQKEIVIIRCSTPNTLCYLQSYSINKEKKLAKNVVISFHGDYFCLRTNNLRPKQLTWVRYCQLHQNIKWKNEIVFFFRCGH